MRAIRAFTIILFISLALISSASFFGTAVAQTQCEQPLMSSVTEGTWTNECSAQNRANSYARFYTFTLTQQTEVTITLESRTDPYLFLLVGTGTAAGKLKENDDIDVSNRNYNSSITTTLDAGDYTIEATTYEKHASGEFTLTVEGIDFDTSDYAQPTPDATPESTPDPTPVPNPTPAECTQSLGIAPVDGTWTRDGCISQNRTENGIHFVLYYTFTLSSAATIEMTLESRTDPYLILLDYAGEIIAQDDDDDEDNFDLSVRDSGIRITLEPGDYTVEATTYGSEATGDFLLTLDRPDFAALRALYHATDGVNWDDNDNWLTDAPLTDWHGIRVDDEGRVIGIYLNSNNLSGEIPAELRRLGHLEGLHLARNNLSGIIPQELGDLHNLKVLALFDNDLTGSIPSQLGSLDNLEEIYLDRNELSGRIPASLGRLSNLRRLRLSANELTGHIPDSFSRLTNLQRLSLAVNHLSGQVPAEFADLDNLTHLYLWGNNLAAEDFIQRIGDMDNLEFLDIGGNRIDGAQVLSKVSELSKLTGLGIHDSGITDEDLQHYMSDLIARGLDFLNIRSNGLSDTQTLVGLSRITTLYRLAINDNNFSGELPRTFTDLKFIRLFYFYDNDDLCAPTDAEFQEWLNGIHDVQGYVCEGGTPTRASQPASSIAAQFAAVPQTLEQPVQPHSLSALAAERSGG